VRTYTAGGGRHAEGGGLLQRAGKRDRGRGKVKLEAAGMGKMENGVKYNNNNDNNFRL